MLNQNSQQRPIQQMQPYPQRKQNKTKYVQPQFFSVSGAMRPGNPAHCRSLVDLNSMEALCHEKQNINMEHFSSVTSNHDNRQTNTHKLNANSNNNSGALQKQPLANHKNISNIAKILLNANHSKQKKIPEAGKNNSFILTQGLKTKNAATPNSGRKNDMFTHVPSNQLKVQARTSSQTHLKEANSSCAKLSAAKQKNQLALEREKSQKSLKKSPFHNIVEGRQNREPDFSLLIKLKQYISVLKENQHKYLQQIQQVQQQNTRLKEETVLLKDRVQVYHIREKQIMKKVKHQQSQLRRLSQKSEGEQSKPHSDCHEHMIIIQSLRNVINEQMSKIIDLETNRLQMQEERKINQHKASDSKLMQSQKYGAQETQPNLSDERMNQFNEVYSFKKRNHLNESSIYIEEESQQSEEPCPKAKPNGVPQSKNIDARHKGKGSYSSIPQPYNELLKCLRSDSRGDSRGSYQELINRQAGEIGNLHQSEQQNANSQQIQNDEYDDDQPYKFKQQCSQDQILHEVGEYLSNIRKNVRQN